jgi:hypothetical protein
MLSGTRRLLTNVLVHVPNLYYVQFIRVSYHVSNIYAHVESCTMATPVQCVKQKDTVPILYLLFCTVRTSVVYEDPLWHDAKNRSTHVDLGRKITRNLFPYNY